MSLTADRKKIFNVPPGPAHYTLPGDLIQKIEDDFILYLLSGKPEW